MSFFVKLMWITSEITSTFMVLKKCSLVTGKFLTSSNALEMILDPDSPEDEELEDQRYFLLDFLTCIRRLWTYMVSFMPDISFLRGVWP